MNIPESGKIILIAGGSGLIGSGIIPILAHHGYNIRILSRNQFNHSQNIFHWNPENNQIDKAAFENVEVVINLAGAGIADKRWTKARKVEILKSRTEPADLLYNVLKDNPYNVKLIINASGIGIYGDAGEQIVSEASPTGNTFLAEICRNWESAANQFNKSGIRTIILRLGNVLSMHGGMLQELMKPMRMGVLPVFGTGNQYQSWIHIQDVGHLISHIIGDETLHGIFNVVSPNPVTQKEFIKLLGKAYAKPHLKVKVPEILLKLMFGEMSTLLLESTNVSCEKIITAGFKFSFPELLPALQNILTNKK